MHCAPVKLQGIHVHISVKYFFFFTQKEKVGMYSYIISYWDVEEATRATRYKIENACHTQIPPKRRTCHGDYVV